MIKITTQRLILRPFQQDDLSALHRLFSCPEVMRFSLNGPYSEEKTYALMNQCIEKSQQNQASLLAVIDKKNRQLIGSCGFFAQTIQGNDELELGYRLIKSEWGKGLATEAATAMKNYAFSEMRLTRLISIIEKDNLASLRVAEKNGFKLEKVMRYDGRIEVGIYAVNA
ncbi:GNAT family N-acetyltransferase [Psychromonas sp. psych-6C06]|uniref:GNAT family N-acetyltransferase n=1 Tax=Psychromonas sp. psych-6C06 TaxID=2058089 RepID=UPI000C325B85|nr:GNAT family N-acetyltransferase [Psychromonas sp. psych-6C06]PKF60789.1 GNAT family N-acetyltransferase [Psychromonas sp. psych-6C06]